MTGFHDTVTRLTDRPMNRARLESLLVAYADWAGPLGVHHADRYINQVRRCAQLGNRIRTGYAVWEEPASYGKDMWIQLIVHNNTDKAAYFTLDGNVWATHLVPTPPHSAYLPHDRKRDAYLLRWGGSSYDSMVAPAHSRSTRIAAMDYSDQAGRLHMRTDGRLSGIRMWMYGQCTFPAYREH